MSYCRLIEMDGVLVAQPTTTWPDTRLGQLYYDCSTDLFCFSYIHAPNRLYKLTGQSLLDHVNEHGLSLFSYEDIYRIGEFVRKVTK